MPPICSLERFPRTGGAKDHIEIGDSSHPGARAADRAGGLPQVKTGTRCGGTWS